MKAAAVFRVDGCKVTKEQEVSLSGVCAMNIIKSYKPAGPSERVASLAIHLIGFVEHLLCARASRGKMNKAVFLSSWSIPKLCHAPNWDVITATVSAPWCPGPLHPGKGALKGLCVPFLTFGRRDTMAFRMGPPSMSSALKSPAELRDSWDYPGSRGSDVGGWS